jgi:hypothetical protein
MKNHPNSLLVDSNHGAASSLSFLDKQRKNV